MLRKIVSKFGKTRKILRISVGQQKSVKILLYWISPVEYIFTKNRWKKKTILFSRDQITSQQFENCKKKHFFRRTSYSTSHRTRPGYATVSHGTGFRKSRRNSVDLKIAALRCTHQQQGKYWAPTSNIKNNRSGVA